MWWNCKIRYPLRNYMPFKHQISGPIFLLAHGFFFVISAGHLIFDCCMSKQMPLWEKCNRTRFMRFDRLHLLRCRVHAKCYVFFFKFQVVVWIFFTREKFKNLITMALECIEPRRCSWFAYFYTLYAYRFQLVCCCRCPSALCMLSQMFFLYFHSGCTFDL